jgi:Phosphotransferase enzyme family
VRTGQINRQEEELLQGGTTNAGLVTRVGDTVRRPLRPTSGATKALLDHLERVGFEAAPRHLGVDDVGREVLSFIPGQAAIAPYPDWALTDDALVSVAHLLRRYHDAVASFDPNGHRWPHPLPRRFDHGLVSHNDPNLDNIIFQNGRAVALIDFDLASPGSVAWDLACTARLWAPLRAQRDTPSRVRRRSLARLALFADAYGAPSDTRAELIEAIVDTHDWCYAIVRRAVAAGHEAFGLSWRGGGKPRADRTRRWLATRAPEMRTALGLEDALRDGARYPSRIAKRSSKGASR